MNKKIFASALFAVAAFVSTFASAQTAYDNSVTQNIIAYAQTANAKVAAGGSSVWANKLVIQGGATAATDIPKDAEIIVRLPTGLNFDGAPSYSVGPMTATQGLTLKDATTFGDPTLDAPGVTMFDTNGDGGMDRAVVVVAAKAATGDTMTISINLKANADATVGTKKASIIVNGGLAVTQDIVDVVASLPEPLLSASGSQLSPADQNGTQNLAVTTATITLTIPKGTMNGKTVTLTPASGLTWASATSTITLSSVLSPVSVNPLTSGITATGVGPASSTTSVSFSVMGGNAVTGLAADTQVVLTVNAVNVAAGAVGTRVLTLGGTAGITGNAALVSVLPNGSSAALTTVVAPATNNAVSIVAGATSAQTLPTIDITENFDNDAGGSTPGTDTITITAGTGLSFSTASVPTFGGAGWNATATVTATTISIVVQTNTITTIPAKLTIGGIKATAASTAAGALSVTVGTPGKNNNKTTAPNGNVIAVANAVALGDVNVSLSGKAGITGPGSAAITSTITLTETTYGAISTAAETQVQDAYVRVTPSANASIIAVTTGINSYPVTATTPTFKACVKETNVTTGAWLCEISAESTAITPTTSTVSVNINYSAKATAAIGSTVDMTMDGNARVAGTLTVANVGVATTATKGAIPDLTPGNTEASNLAPITITENFPGAVTLGREFRLIGPTGVAFQDAAGIAAQSPGVATATITATFAPNDTLVMTTAATNSITFTPKAVIASTLAGMLSFDIVNGNIDGAGKAGVTGEPVMAAYADGTLGALDAGADTSLNVNFSAVNAVTGGLVAYTAKSSSTAIATASVNGTNVTVTGKSAGVATITVTDALGGTDTYLVTVSAGAAQPAAKAPKSVGGDVSDATFTGGASKDGGATYATEFTTEDDVTLVGTVNVATADQGTDGEIHVVVLSITEDGAAIAFKNESGNFETWDQTIGGLGAAEVATPLAASHNVVVFSGKLAAGTHKVALAYTTSAGKIVYTGNAVKITVTE